MMLAGKYSFKDLDFLQLHYITLKGEKKQVSQEH